MDIRFDLLRSSIDLYTESNINFDLATNQLLSVAGIPAIVMEALEEYISFLVDNTSLQELEGKLTISRTGVYLNDELTSIAELWQDKNIYTIGSLLSYLKRFRTSLESTDSLGFSGGGDDGGIDAPDEVYFKKAAWLPDPTNQIETVLGYLCSTIYELLPGFNGSSDTYGFVIIDYNLLTIRIRYESGEGCDFFWPHDFIKARYSVNSSYLGRVFKPHSAICFRGNTYLLSDVGVIGKLDSVNQSIPESYCQSYDSVRFIARRAITNDEYLNSLISENLQDESELNTSVTTVLMLSVYSKAHLDTVFVLPHCFVRDKLLWYEYPAIITNSAYPTAFEARDSTYSEFWVSPLVNGNYNPVLILEMLLDIKQC